MANSDHVIRSGDAGEDAVITATARALAQYPGPVLLRWFWEFNVLVNNQSCRGDTGGKPTQQVYTDFIAAWRHIRQLFQNAGAANVVFLWNPGHYGSDGAPDDPHNLYPGNDYVDWIGLDAYQDDVSTTFAANIEPFYSDFSESQYGGKPLMVGENGTKTGRITMKRYRRLTCAASLRIFRTISFPRLKAYCYFDSTGARGDWTLDDNNGQGSGGRRQRRRPSDVDGNGYMMAGVQVRQPGCTSRMTLPGASCPTPARTEGRSLAMLMLN